MNMNDSEFDVQRQIQRLADHELSEDEKDELFLELDMADNEDWRALALALIERDEIRDVLSSRTVAPKVVAMRSWVPRIAALVACLALGFLAGASISDSVEEPHVALQHLPEPLPSSATMDPPEPVSTVAPLFVESSGYDITVRNRLIRAEGHDRVVYVPVREIELRSSL